MTDRKHHTDQHERNQDISGKKGPDSPQRELSSEDENTSLVNTNRERSRRDKGFTEGEPGRSDSQSGQDSRSTKITNQDKNITNRGSDDAVNENQSNRGSDS